MEGMWPPAWVGAGSEWVEAGMQLRQWPKLLLTVAHIHLAGIQVGQPPSGDTSAGFETEGVQHQLQGPTRVLAQQVVPAEAASMPFTSLASPGTPHPGWSTLWTSPSHRQSPG